ncbi:MAG: hypothetical protein NVS9B9_10310 [Ktedonobacteraceae bacterium]
MNCPRCGWHGSARHGKIFWFFVYLFAFMIACGIANRLHADDFTESMDRAARIHRDVQELIGPQPAVQDGQFGYRDLNGNFGVPTYNQPQIIIQTQPQGEANGTTVMPAPRLKPFSNGCVQKHPNTGNYYFEHPEERCK